MFPFFLGDVYFYRSFFGASGQHLREPGHCRGQEWRPSAVAEEPCFRSTVLLRQLLVIYIYDMTTICYNKLLVMYGYNVIEWASAQVPPTPLYLGGTVGGERERDREGEGEGERGIDR